MTRTKRNDAQFPLLKLYKYSYYTVLRHSYAVHTILLHIVHTVSV
jgi:hypothetical protein